MKIIRIYFALISAMFPRIAGKQAFKMFQKVRKKEISTKEHEFYNHARFFKIKSSIEDLHAYEMGNPNGKLVLLVHGWDSNAGSLSKFAFRLSEMNYRVVSIDLPGHTYYKKNKSNIYECKEAIKELLLYLQPVESISVISHSFGSSVVSYAFSEMDLTINKMVFLTSPNKIYDIFCDYKEMIQLGDKAFNYMCKLSENIIGEKIEGLIIKDKLEQINFNKLLIIHDKYDKILPIQNAEEMIKLPKDITLKIFERIGHYRMLWNKEVLEDTIGFIAD